MVYGTFEGFSRVLETQEKGLAVVFSEPEALITGAGLAVSERAGPRTARRCRRRRGELWGEGRDGGGWEERDGGTAIRAL